MRALIVKTSSLGDVIHALPAVTDALRARPGLRFDWLVEEAFVEVPGWHPAVDAVIPVALRRWRRAPLAAWRSGEWRRLRRRLAATHYDIILNTQKLIKNTKLKYLTHNRQIKLNHTSTHKPLTN